MYTIGPINMAPRNTVNAYWWRRSCQKRTGAIVRGSPTAFQISWTREGKARRGLPSATYIPYVHMCTHVISRKGRLFEPPGTCFMLAVSKFTYSQELIGHMLRAGGLTIHLLQLLLLSAVRTLRQFRSIFYTHVGPNYAQNILILRDVNATTAVRETPTKVGSSNSKRSGQKSVTRVIGATIPFTHNRDDDLTLMLCTRTHK